MIGSKNLIVLLFAILLAFVAANEIPQGEAPAENRIPVLTLGVSVPDATTGELHRRDLIVYEGESPYTAAVRFGQQHGLNQEGIATVTKYIVDRAGELVKRVLFTTNVNIERDNGEVEQVAIEVFEGASPEKVAQEVAIAKGLDENAAVALAQHVAQLIEEKTLLRVRINLPTESGEPHLAELVVQEGSDPKRVVAQFAKKHALTAEASQKVEDHVMNQLTLAMQARQEQAQQAQQTQTQPQAQQPAQDQDIQAAVQQAANQLQAQADTILNSPLKLTIDIGDGKKAILEVKPNDKVAELAQQFATEHGLAADTVNRIGNFIVQEWNKRRDNVQQEVNARYQEILRQAGLAQ